MNHSKIGIEAEQVQVLGTLDSLCCKKRFVVECKPESNFISKKAKEKWIEEFVESKIAAARKRVGKAEAVVERERKTLC